MREERIVQTPQEVIKLFPLFHAFFDSVEVDYTEKQFFDKLPWILQNGVIGYITDDDFPVAYGIIIKTDWFGTVGMILQVYSKKPFLVARLQKMADNWCRENNITKQVSLVSRFVAETMKKRYGMKPEFLFMSRNVPQTQEEVQESEVVV